MVSLVVVECFLLELFVAIGWMVHVQSIFNKKKFQNWSLFETKVKMENDTLFRLCSIVQGKVDVLIVKPILFGQLMSLVANGDYIMFIFAAFSYFTQLFIFSLEKCYL